MKLATKDSTARKATRPTVNPKPVRRWLLGGGLLLLVCLVGAGTVVGWSNLWQLINGRGWMTLNPANKRTEFPQIDTSQLSSARQKLLNLAKTEFEAQAPGTKYSQGVRQAWCANFISWLHRQTGQPLQNPHTGGWRIPGTFTLREYYQQAGRFRPVDSGYQPRPGDVAIYRGSPLFGDHTNLVLSYNDGVLTTVGGNENNQVNVYVNQQRQYTGLLGYGVID